MRRDKGRGNEWELEEVGKGRKVGERKKEEEGGASPGSCLYPSPRYEILDNKNC